MNPAVDNKALLERLEEIKTLLLEWEHIDKGDLSKDVRGLITDLLAEKTQLEQALWRDYWLG